MPRRLLGVAAACACALVLLVAAAQPAEGATPAETRPGRPLAFAADPSPAPPGIQVGPSLPGAVPTATAGAPGTPGTASQGCPLIDFTCHVQAAIDGWFVSLVTSALNPVLGLLGRTVLATPDVAGGKVAVVWGVTAGIANAAVVLLVLAGGAVVMSHETLQTRYAAKDVAARIVVAVVAANASLSLVGLAVSAANALSQALLGSGVDPSSATSAMSQLVVPPLAAGGTFVVLLGLVALVLAVILLLTYIVRVALLVLAVGVAPLALICHALPQAEGAARLWWRAVAGLLAIQIGQSLVLICALKVFFTPDGPATLGLSASGGLVDILVVICLLWVMVKIPTWVSRAVFGPGRTSTVAKAFKVAVIYKVAKAGLAALA